MDSLKILAEIIVILFAFSGLLADIIILLMLRQVKKGARLYFGYIPDEEPDDD